MINTGIYNLTEMILNNLFIAVFLPFWLFLIIMVGRFFSVYVNKKVIYFLTLLSSFLGIILSSLALWKLPCDSIVENQIPFIKINDFILSYGVLVDKTALIFLLVLFSKFFGSIFFYFIYESRKENI